MGKLLFGVTGVVLVGAISIPATAATTAESVRSTDVSSSIVKIEAASIDLPKLGGAPQSIPAFRCPATNPYLLNRDMMPDSNVLLARGVDFTSKVGVGEAQITRVTFNANGFAVGWPTDENSIAKGLDPSSASTIVINGYCTSNPAEAYRF